MFIESLLCGRPWRVKTTLWNISFSRSLVSWRWVWLLQTQIEYYTKWLCLCYSIFLLLKMELSNDLKIVSSEKRMRMHWKDCWWCNCGMQRVLEICFDFASCFLALNSSLPSAFCERWCNLPPAKSKLPFISTTMKVPIKPSIFKMKGNQKPEYTKESWWW